jgi:hypothetical protein
MKITETVNIEYFNFAGLWEIPSACGLKIFKASNNNVVIVSELYRKNPGTSIADVPVQLATQICNKYSIDFESLIYVEHNPKTETKLSFYEEEFFRVRFNVASNKLSNPQYEMINQAELDTILTISD